MIPMGTVLWESAMIHAKGLNFWITYEGRSLPLEKEMYHSESFLIDAFALLLAQLTSPLFLCLYKIAASRV